MSDILVFRQRVRLICHTRAIVFAFLGAFAAERLWQTTSFFTNSDWTLETEIHWSTYLAVLLGFLLGWLYGWSIGLRDRVLADVAYRVEQIEENTRTPT